jgi:regulator of RNase E activity RraA
MTMDESQFVAELQQVDSPTVANAIEGLELRDKTVGFTDVRLRCLRAKEQPMVGYAVTVKVDTSTPGLKPDPAKSRELSDRLFQAMRDAPKPVVVCLQESGPHPDRATHMGDVLGTGLSRAGAVGIVSGSGIRDLAGLEEEDLWLFARGRVVAHGVYTITDVNTDIEIAGLKISPGDLLHGNEDGIVTVPTEQPERLLELIQECIDTETAARARFRGAS